MDYSTFFKISYGLYIVSSRSGDKLNGHISNTVFQISSDPPLFAIASHKDNLTTRYIDESRVFSVSILQEDISLDFMGPWGFKKGDQVNKFSSVKFITGKTGAPIVLDKCIGFIEFEVEDRIDTGSHILFIGRAIDAQLLQKDATPLTYAYYRSVIKGVSPETAPTFIDKSMLERDIAGQDAPSKDTKTLKKYRCLVCGYEYNPEEGDPTKNIPPGTPFEELPANWLCPICGVGKKEFMPIE